MFFKSKNEKSLRFRTEMAQKLDGRHIRYVSERGAGNTDEIIGREGALLVRDGEFIVYADQTVLFRTKIADLCASELLSLEGAVIKGPDTEHGGKERTVIAYYKYYR